MSPIANAKTALPDALPGDNEVRFTSPILRHPIRTANDREVGANSSTERALLSSALLLLQCLLPPPPVVEPRITQADLCRRVRLAPTPCALPTDPILATASAEPPIISPPTKRVALFVLGVSKAPSLSCPLRRGRPPPLRPPRWPLPLSSSPSPWASCQADPLFGADPVLLTTSLVLIRRSADTVAVAFPVSDGDDSARPKPTSLMPRVSSALPFPPMPSFPQSDSLAVAARACLFTALLEASVVPDAAANADFVPVNCSWWMAAAVGLWLLPGRRRRRWRRWRTSAGNNGDESTGHAQRAGSPRPTPSKMMGIRQASCAMWPHGNCRSVCETRFCPAGGAGFPSALLVLLCTVPLSPPPSL